ncbi:MAG: TIGR02099 family protein [Candidatus Oceanisphaera merdipullorum]|nr:TIGR02099 family protein [Candidatus Oceanisphaera merdipullorum]
MFKRSLNWAWLSVAAVAVLLAVLVTVLRFGAPWLAQAQQQWLDGWLSEHQIELQIGGVGLTWQDYGPILALNDVTLRRADAPTITLRRALVNVQLWQSLRQWRPVLNELTLEGLRLPIALEDKDSASPPAPVDWQGLRHFVLDGVEQFSLQDAELLLSRGEQPLFQLHLPDWHWLNRPGKHQGQGSLAFSEQAPQQLQVRSQFSGELDSLDGQLYINADGVNASDLLTQIRPDDPLVSAELNFEFWLEWQQGQLIAGILDLGENRFGWGEQHQVAINGGRVQWQPTPSGWQLASNKVDISVDNEVWPSWHLQVDRQGELLQGTLDRLTFTDVALLAQWGESFLPNTAKQLEGIAPRGQLTDLYFSAAPSGKDWYWQGNLEDVSTQAFGWAPATQGLNGHFVLASDSGELSVQQAKAEDWEFDRAFRGPWPLEQVDAKIKWQQQASKDWLLWSEQLAVDTQDLTLEGWFSLLLPTDAEPLLSASARVDVLRAGEAYRYFPEPVMGAALVDYLQGAIVAGQAKGAEVLWYGRLNGFPYKDQSGIFQARVPLRQAEFRFDPHWLPLTDLSLDLLFENDGLYMTGKTGRLGKVNATDITADIAPLHETSKLELTANINGEGGAVSEYLQDSPLASSVGVTLEQVQVSGPLNAQLALSIPLKGGSAVAVKGQVDFANNDVRVKPLDLPLNKVSGHLLFDEQHTKFTDLSASWLDQPMQLSYLGKESAKGYEVELGIKGKMLPEKLQHLHPAMKPLSGNADWRGQLQLTLPHQGALHYVFDADSTLAGLTSGLPAPFNKTRQQSLTSKLSVTGTVDQAKVALQVGEHIRSSAQLSFTKQGPNIEQLWLSAGAGVNVSLPRPPLDIGLRVPQLVLDDWVSLLGDLPSLAQPIKSVGKASASGFSWPEHYRVVMHASRAQLWQQPFHQLSLVLTPDNQGREQLVIKAEQVDGKLSFGGNKPIQANFKRLWLGDKQAVQLAANAAAKPPIADIKLTPAQVPALHFQCEDCRWQQVGFGQVTFDLQPLAKENGVQLSQFLVDGPLLKAKASGQWLQQNSVNLSRLEWQSSSSSLQHLWQAFGKESPFSDTSAQLSGKLRWLSPPWQPELASMNGELAVKTGSGVLRELKTKGAGLLSVLSLESVMRRLRLDFRDVFAQGFYFDSIAASGQLQAGVLTNKDLLIKGAAGDLRAQGELNFATEQLNYNVELTPHLTGNLPVLTAFAVAPVAGLYVLALSKVLGPVVDVFTRIRYQVTGPISAPQVIELGRDKKRMAVSE